MSNGDARRHHEKVVFQQDALRLLRNGYGVTDVAWKQLHPGSRIAPVVDKLRNAHGFAIEGRGSMDAPYIMRDVFQVPTLVAVSDEMKAAYYETEHWKQMREWRMDNDSHQCIICSYSGEIVVHHIIYKLFDEHIDDLMTVCAAHHDKLHRDARLKFPSGMSVDNASRLHIPWEFPDWLMPRFALSN